MTNVLKSYHLFCIFLLYVGRLSPTSSKTDINNTLCNCFLQSLSHFLACENVNCFADSIMQTYFDRYVQSTPTRKPHISEITGSCCLYTSIHTSLQTQSKLFFTLIYQYTYQSSDLVKNVFFNFKQQYTDYQT